MHIHILGICGTFMAGVARLAAAAGHKVTGSDANAYARLQRGRYLHQTRFVGDWQRHRTR